MHVGLVIHMFNPALSSCSQRPLRLRIFRGSAVILHFGHAEAGLVRQPPGVEVHLPETN